MLSCLLVLAGKKIQYLLIQIKLKVIFDRKTNISSNKFFKKGLIVHICPKYEVHIVNVFAITVQGLNNVE